MKYGLINFFVCFVFASLIAPLIIGFLRKIKFGQSILVYVEKHKSKAGTPTMGGIIFILSTTLGYLISFSSNNTIATISFLSFLFFGMVGFLDDFIKIKFKQNEGLKPYQKIIGQLGIAIAISVFVYRSGLVGSEVIIPFSSQKIDLSFWIIPFAIFVYLAVVNSVNLIDGLDGLCGSISSIVLVAITLILYIVSDGLGGVQASEILNLNTLSFGVVGGVLGFLLFNSNKASCFMGDTGSLALGGYLASVFVLTKEYLLFLILGLPFVLTVLSVVMQVGYYKLTKKRIFKMAPLHHHFEMTYGETKVVAWYGILTIILCVLTITFYL